MDESLLAQDCLGGIGIPPSRLYSQHVFTNEIVCHLGWVSSNSPEIIWVELEFHPPDYTINILRLTKEFAIMGMGEF